MMRHFEEKLSIIHILSLILFFTVSGLAGPRNKKLGPGLEKVPQMI